MDTAVIISLISMSFLILVQIALMAYGYGRLSQKVDDMCRRLDKVENRVIQGQKIGG